MKKGFGRSSKELFDNGIGKVRKGLEAVTNIGSNARSRGVNFVQSILDLIPIFEKAGFRTNRLIVGVSVVPSIELHFAKYKDCGETEIEEVREDLKESRLGMAILNALLMASSFQDRLSSERLKFAEVNIHATVPPKVAIKYLHKNLAGIGQKEGNPGIDENP